MNNKKSKKPKQSNKSKPKPKKQLAPSILRPFPNQFIKD